MNLKNYLSVDDGQLERFSNLKDRYKLLYNDPENCTPMIIVETPVPNQPRCEERLADPMVMLRAELDGIRPHLEIEDDRLPSIRVQFGTAMVAAAFGCDIYVPPNSLPAAASHVLANLEDAHTLKMPSLDAGWYGKMWEWTRLWQENMPPGVQIQHPDIQSPFNNAHLVRGNDILLDFYENPETVPRLLDVITDYMIALTKHAKAMISDDDDWFLDWGGMWKGFARISNCSMDMISPELYTEYVLPRDIRFFQAIGGGRIHYCGTHEEVIRQFFKNPLVSALDVDNTKHDFYHVCEIMPAQVSLYAGITPQILERLLAGDWPKKRNVVLIVPASSPEEGKNLLKQLRAIQPWFQGPQ